MPKRNAGPDLDELWEPSSSEDEDWEDGEWEVNGITKDHVHTRGDLRFNISWAGWKRTDGSHSTWEIQGGTTMEDLAAIQHAWEKSQQRDLMQEARSPTVPPFGPFPSRETVVGESPADGRNAKQKQVFHYTFTELAHQARQMAVHLKNESDFAESSSLETAHEQLQHMRNTRDQALRNMASSISEAPSARLYDLGPAPQGKKRYQAQKKISLSRQMKSLRLSSYKSQNLPTPAAHSDTAAPEPIKPVSQYCVSGALAPEKMSFKFAPEPRGQPVFKKLAIATRETRSLPQRDFFKSRNHPEKSEQYVASDQTRKRTLPSGPNVVPVPECSNNCIATSPARNVPNAREKLQAKWSKAIQKEGAAPVTFVHDFDEGSTPVHDIATFKYLESTYLFSNVLQPSDNFMESCECAPGCTASFCSCQDDSDIQNDDGDKVFAYDANGLFAFRDITSYVIECSQKCLCDAFCRSRVAQRPRQFPIEVFRTEYCGWGVRSTVALQKGSVLGVYTGRIITRSETLEYSARHSSYVFDLDFMKRAESVYSVDAYHCGNWTRFVNHSCNPVCTLYPVIWDSVPSMHQPKLAFVANTDIPALTELTIDYDPKARKGKGRAKSKIPGTPDCRCKSQECRGFIYTL